MRFSERVVLAVAAGLAACNVGTGPQMSQVQVRLTDASQPALSATSPPTAGISAASATISTVYLVGAAGTRRDTIKTGATVYDLLTLKDNVNTLLADATIQAGDYSQLRLVVDEANVTLDDGSSFTLKVPSGLQTGIKVVFGGPIHLEPPSATIVVDFDVSGSFIVTGGTPPHQVLFTPVLHGEVQN